MSDKYDSYQDTIDHIVKVQEYGKILSRACTEAYVHHDMSKLADPEKAIFDEFTPKLKGVEYGSDEYKGFLESMGVALKHHYAENRHHPEHHENGIKGMTLVDLCEMICDWMAATKRMKDGNIYTSIEQNQKRFGYSDELKQIFINTVSRHF